jgi:hypothetical protein
MKPRHAGVARKLLLIATLALASADATATTVAYGSRFFTGIDYVFLGRDGQWHTITDMQTGVLPSAAAFAGNDYSTQYILDFTVGRMYSIDVNAPHDVLIGATDTGDNQPIGLHWDPTSSQMYLIANDSACTTTTLYVVSLTNAATFEIGSTPRCIVSLAIDADGNGFGIDQDEDALVSIDIGTGAAATIGPLGFSTSTLVGGLDFDPTTGVLNLFATDDDTHVSGRYLVDVTQGTATRVATYDFAPLGVALADLPETILANGFDP